MSKNVVSRTPRFKRQRRLGTELPRDDVRVVFDLGEQDLVALPKELPPEPVGDQVDGLGGPPVEHDG